MLKVLKNRIIIAGWHAVRTSIVLAPELCIRVWLDKKNTQKFSLELERQLQLLNLRIEHVEKSTLKKICGNDRHQGVVLERRVPAQINFTAFIENVLEAKNADDLLFLILDRIQDPRNFGACLRTADCVGATAVIYPSNNNVGLTSVAAQAAAGAIDCLPLLRVSNLSQAMRALKSKGVQLIGTDSSAAQSIYEVDLCAPTAIVVGNEGVGLRNLTKSLCNKVVSLPVIGTIPSLNVSAATSVFLYEVLRQRIS